MNIVRDRDKGTLFLTQKDYLEKVLKRFQMENSQPVSIPLAQQFKLSKEQCPKSEEERQKMSKIPYARIIGSIMCTLWCVQDQI